MDQNKIAFITDLHLGESGPIKKGANPEQNWATVLQDISQRGIRQIIFGGDLAEKNKLEGLFSEVQNFGVDVILGNHDKYKSAQNYFSAGDSEVELYYAKSLGSFHGIFLDTSSQKLSKDQQEFLRAELAVAEKPVVFIHHPVLNIGTWMDKNWPLKNRDETKKILLECGKPVELISGHYHLAHEYPEDSLSQHIAPAVSYKICYNPDKNISDISEFGYLLLDFNGDNLVSESIIFRK